MEQQSTGELRLSPELLEQFLTHLNEIGRSKGTVAVYRRHLERLYAMLPESKTVGPDTLLRLRERLQAESTANNTINLFVSSANTLLEYCGHRELQLSKPLERKTPRSPELDREEYLRLLSAAKQLNKERAYLLVKVFATTGLYVRELPEVTVESVRAGRICLTDGDGVHIPPCLREELLQFCAREGILSGPVFVTHEGKAVVRAYVNYTIQSLARDARVAPEKCNPLALRRLYLATRESIWNDLTRIAEQAHDHMIESEQRSVGWECPGA